MIIMHWQNTSFDYIHLPGDIHVDRQNPSSIVNVRPMIIVMNQIPLLTGDHT